jgi:hypothetical protein
MSGDHAKREIVTDEKPAGSKKTLSRESGNKYTRRNPLTPSSHIGGVTRRRRK